MPQTVACQLGILAVNLHMWLLSADFARPMPLHFCHTSPLILTFSKYAIQHVAVVPAKVPNTKYAIFFKSSAGGCHVSGTSVPTGPNFCKSSAGGCHVSGASVINKMLPAAT